MTQSNPPSSISYHVVHSSIKPLSLRVIDEQILMYWFQYMRKKLEYDVQVNQLNFKISPYFGLVFNEYEMLGQPFFIDLDCGSIEPVTLSMPRALLNIVLGEYLDPLLPEHFDDEFLCNILEMIFVDIIQKVKEETGLKIRFMPFAGAKGAYKAQLRITLNDDNQNHYPILVVGKQWDINHFVEKFFLYARPKIAYQPKLTVSVVSFVRKIFVSRLKNLKLGEIIILILKRHPINEPLVFIGDKIVAHTRLGDMNLELLEPPRMAHDIEELRMSSYGNDDELPDNQQAEYASDNEASRAGGANNELNAALNDYKVTVVFELNRLEIPINIVSQLTNGTVLNLQKAITEDIALTVAGRTIAVGEVVQVGRNFGVLIKEVFNG